MSRFDLRDYQRECIDAIPDTGSHLIQMATGLGKTVTFSQIQRNGRVLLLSHRQELVEQPRKYYDCAFGIERAASHSHGEDVVSASVQTMVRRLGDFKRDAFDTIITDEAHHAASNTYQTIYEYFTPNRHLGFTATPNRGDGKRLDGVYEDIVFSRNLMWGIEHGFLCDINCIRIKADFDLSQIAYRMGDYSESDLNKIMGQKEMIEAVRDAYDRYAKGPTMIFACTVEHAEKIASAIPGAVAVSGKTKERSEIVERFKHGDVKCLVNCMVFTEGTDIPCIESIIMARPTASEALYTQMAGRGLRPYPGKEYMNLIDLVGATGSHRLCGCTSLIGVEDDKVEASGSIRTVAEKAKTMFNNPTSWIMNAKKVDIWAKENRYDTHFIHFFKLPDGSLKVSFPDDRMARRKFNILIGPEDALGNVRMCGETFKMQDALDVLYGELIRNHKDKASLWDSRAIKRWGPFPASDKQRRLIERRFPEFAGKVVTRADASQIIDGMFSC